MAIQDAHEQRLGRLIRYDGAQKNSGAETFSGEAIRVNSPTDAHAWLTRCQAALEDIFPLGHAVRRRWEALVGAETFDAEDARDTERAAGIMLGALSLVQDGYLSTFRRGVLAESVMELLDAAGDHVEQDHLVAATVIAGGALESHLRHLCEKAGIPTENVRGITALDGEIGKARKAGNEVYTVAESSQVKTWAIRRNEAAHTPLLFQRKRVEVQLFVDGIRQFVSQRS